MPESQSDSLARFRSVCGRDPRGGMASLTAFLLPYSQSAWRISGTGWCASFHAMLWSIVENAAAQS